MKKELKKNKFADSRLEVARGIKEGAAGVDRNYEDDKHRGVIRGIAVMTKGQVKDCRAWKIDDMTLSQIVAEGNKHTKTGLKSRFGHPSMSSTALGTFLGRAKNFFVDGDIARADLYLSKTAYETPDGDLASYVLNLAEKDPDAFGTSVVLGDYDLEEQLDEKGKVMRDENDEPIVALRVKSLFAVDAVDDPAANNGMFGKFFNDSVQLSAKGAEFLDKLLSNPDALDYVVAFLERYRANRADIDQDQSRGETPEKVKHNTEEKHMSIELKDLTVEMLSQERPDLVAGLKTEGNEAAKLEGVNEERARGLAIVKSAHSEFAGMGMDAVVEEALESGKTVDAALAAMRKKRLDDIAANANKAPGADQDAASTKSHLDRAREYQKTHGGTMTAALQATAEKRK